MIICQLVSFAEQPSKELMKRHRRFLNGQGEQKKLLMAGRFADKTGSLMLWQVGSVKEARDIALQDPYFRNEITTFILKEWNLTWDFTIGPPLQPELT